MSDREIARKIDIAWAINTKKDFCKVGKATIPFDIICDLSKAISYSPNVNANRTNTLTVTHRIQGVVGNAGEGIESGVSQLVGEVILTNGSSTVNINGKSSVRDGDSCLMNCSAAGKSNVAGKIYTSKVEAFVARMREIAKDSPLPETQAYWQVLEESSRAAGGAVKGWTDAIATTWQATGFTGSPEEIAAARSSMGASLQFMGDLFGAPPPEMVMYAGLSGDSAMQQLVVDMQTRNLAAVNQLAGGVQQAWNEAYSRNGLLGAVTHMVVGLGMEAFVGPKGLGLTGKLAVKGIGMVSGKVLSKISRGMGGAGSLQEKVALMEKEIAAAKAAGESAEDIAALTQARDELAAAAKPKGPGDGTYVAKVPPEPKVTATARIKGKEFEGTNQEARTDPNPDKRTAAADEIKAGKKYKPSHPNTNMENAHAEIEAMQKASDAGVTQGGSMTIDLTGQDMCTFCRSNVAVMADKIGLSELTVNGPNGEISTWIRGVGWVMKSW